MLSRIMPGPFRRPRPEVKLANWLMVALFGFVMFALSNQTAGFLFLLMGTVGAILAWPETRWERSRRRKGVEPPR